MFAYVYIRMYNSSSLSSSRLWTIVPFHRIHPWFRVRDGRGRTAVRSNSTCLNNYSLQVVRRGGERGWARAKNKINRRRSGGWLHDYRGNSLKRNELYRDVGRVHLFHESPFPFSPPPFFSFPPLEYVRKKKWRKIRTIYRMNVVSWKYGNSQFDDSLFLRFNKRRMDF